MNKQSKTSNNINININLSMKDSAKPAGKKIQNHIKIGPSAMEMKRMTMLTQRLQQRKREIESYHEHEESQYMKAKMTGYTTKKQRSKTTRMQPDQIVTAFSTTNAKGKFNSRDVKEAKETPVKVKKVEDFSSKQKKNKSSEKIKSRRDSKNCGSTDNLKKIKVNRSPAKSQSKSNSKQRSNSNQKRYTTGVKKNPKLTLDPPKASTIEAKQTIYSNPGNIKNSKSKTRIVNNKGSDDIFIKKAPQIKKPPQQKSINALSDNPMAISRSSHFRKVSNPLGSKSAEKRKASPTKKRISQRTAAILIQKIWKGYWTRKNFLSQIESIVKNNKKVKQMIANNSKRFWQDSSHNSIKFLNVNIEDSFTNEDRRKPSLELFSGEEVMSIDGSSDDLSPFDRLIKMSQKVGDSKLAKELRDMAENLLKQDLQKKKVIRENRQLKQDILQMKEESVHHNLPIPLILPQPQFDNYLLYEEEPVIIMPVKLETSDKISDIQKTQKKYNFEKKEKKNVQIQQSPKIEAIQKVEIVQKVEKQLMFDYSPVAKDTKREENILREQKVDNIFVDPVNLVEWNSAKQQIQQEQTIEKKKLIEQLKSFKGQSDSMMKKVQKNKDLPHLTNSQKAQIEDQQSKSIFNSKVEQKKKILPQIQKPQQLVLDYQLNNQSSDSEQFREAIKRSELESLRRDNVQPSEFLNQQRQKQIKNDQKRNQLTKPPEIVNLNPDARQYSEDSQDQGASRNFDMNNSQIQKKGFETNLNFVKEYCIGLCEYVRGTEQVKNKFKEEVVKPINLKITQLLKSYRKTIEKKPSQEQKKQEQNQFNEFNNQYNSFKYDYVYPYYRQTMGDQGLIKFETFQKFNETLMNLKRNSHDASEEDIKLQAIHLKSLLDVFNESLNYERPSGLYGEPLPWAPKVRNLKNVNSSFQEGQQNAGDEYGKQNEKFDQLFGVSIARVIQWGSSLCGFIPQSIDMNTDIQIDDEYINHIKETRMALMLQKTLAEDQEKMLEFTDVETEVKLEIGMKILEDLILQAFEEIEGEPEQENFQYFE